MTTTPHPKRYRVSAAERRPLVTAVTEGLVAGGATILEHPDPNVAPFEYRILTHDGETLHLVAYLFRANKYIQGKRPTDEHRFQIKYGSRFDEYHYLDLPARGDRHSVTLFLGVHLEEGIFVGCDPSMHNPTWFSKSVEFKEEHVNQARASGWHAWERDRHGGGRRKRPLPLLDSRIETVVAFTPGNLLRYVALERVATGLAPGERLLLAEVTPGGRQHALEIELGLSPGEILDMIQQSFRLKVAARGGAAEVHLGKLLERVPGITQIDAIDKDACPDFALKYRRRQRVVTIECKNVLRSHRLSGLPIVEYQKTRASKRDPVCGRYYSTNHCDVLAACLHPITERWDFKFCAAQHLPIHQRCPGKVHPRVPVGGDWWTDAVEQLLDELTRR